MKADQALAIVEAHRTELESERNKWWAYHDWYMATNSRAQTKFEIEGLPELDRLSLETNYAYAWIDTLRASVCPSNPQVSIAARNPEVAEVARLRSSLANDTMRWVGFADKIRRMVGHAAWVGYGVTKTVWDGRRKRPQTSNINPLGFFWDRSVQAWEDVGYCCEAVVLKQPIFDKRLLPRRQPDGQMRPDYNPAVAEKAKPMGYPQWLRRPDAGDLNSNADPGRDVFRHVLVWEFYDFYEGKLFHLLDGVEEPLMEVALPYKYVRNPFDQLTFNDNLMDTTGISDIHLIANHIQRLNELDTIELLHALKSIPILLWNKGLMKNRKEFMEALQKVVGPGANIPVEVSDNSPLSALVGTTPTPSIGPNYGPIRERIEAKILFTLALPQFMRGGVGNSDLATELSLANANVNTRNGIRVAAIDRVVSSVARKYVGLWAQYWPKDQPIPIREQGKDSAEQFDREDLAFDNVDSFEKDWWFEYETAPYSPTENHALVQLQKLQQFAPLLLQLPFVDNEKFTDELLRLLRLTKIKGKGPDAAPMAMPGTPGQPGMAGVPGNDLTPEQQQAFALLQGANPSPIGVSEAPVELGGA